MDANTHHRTRLPIRAKLATTVGDAAASVSRLAGKGDGSVIGGRIGLRLEPDLLSLLAAGRQVVLVTGTNGKTTTTRLITAALAPLGGQIASNIYGANMDAGAVSALSRTPDARIAVLETDEKYIPSMVRATRPRVVDAAEPEPGPDGPGGRDLAAGPALAGGAGGRPGLPGGGQRRRPARRLVCGRVPAGHLGRRRAGVARGLLVLPELRRPPAAGRRRLVLPGVRRPSAPGELDALRRSGHRPVRPADPAGARPARPGEPG